MQVRQGKYDGHRAGDTAFGKWGVGTARIDRAIAVGSEERRAVWAVAEEGFPEQDGARGTAVPLSDHLLIELRRSVVRPWAELEQRPVAVRLDSSAVGRETAAAYAAVATGPGFAEQLRLAADAAQARGLSGIASVTGTLRALGEQVAGPAMRGAGREGGDVGGSRQGRRRGFGSRKLQ